MRAHSGCSSHTTGWSWRSFVGFFSSSALRRVKAKMMALSWEAPRSAAVTPSCGGRWLSGYPVEPTTTPRWTGSERLRDATPRSCGRHVSPPPTGAGSSMRSRGSSSPWCLTRTTTCTSPYRTPQRTPSWLRTKTDCSSSFARPSSAMRPHWSASWPRSV